MTHYRVPLFERMRALLKLRDIDLDVVHGDPTQAERMRADGGVLPWARHVPCRYWLDGKLCWQPAWPAIRGADLVVVTQENKLLLNYQLQLRRHQVPMALWGHGKNFLTPSPNGLRERFKRLSVRHVDWWFAYTRTTADIIGALGVPAERMTVVNNAIDTASLHADLRAVEGESDAALRSRWNLADGPVGLLLGSLYAEKRIDFILDAARRVREQVPDFQLLVVGEGAQRSLLEGVPWIRCIGAQQGLAKARCMKVSSVMLNPFGVGLVVLDSFAARLPLVATRSREHGPEFGYLKDGVNCVITPADVAAYADGVVGLLRDPQRRSALAEASADYARELTLENMAQRFCVGIEQCLDKLHSGRRHEVLA
jgi:glycosyltransferase involved in cell wall biosynthesis